MTGYTSLTWLSQVVEFARIMGCCIGGKVVRRLSRQTAEIKLKARAMERSVLGASVYRRRPREDDGSTKRGQGYDWTM